MPCPPTPAGARPTRRSAGTSSGRRHRASRVRRCIPRGRRARPPGLAAHTERAAGHVVEVHGHHRSPLLEERAATIASTSATAAPCRSAVTWNVGSAAMTRASMWSAATVAWSSSGAAGVEGVVDLRERRPGQPGGPWVTGWRPASTRRPGASSAGWRAARSRAATTSTTRATAGRSPRLDRGQLPVGEPGPLDRPGARQGGTLGPAATAWCWPGDPAGCITGTMAALSRWSSCRESGSRSSPW